MKKIQWAALASVGAFAGAMALANANRSNASGTTSASSSSASSSTQKSAAPASVASTGFRASEFEGVSVRERPASTWGKRRSSTSRGWIALKPGEPRFKPGEAQSRGFTILRHEKGTTPRGGDMLVGAGLMRSQIATRDARGRVTLQCVPGESKAAHAAHRTHTARKAAR